MFTKSVYFLSILASLIILFFMQILYFYFTKTVSDQDILKRQAFVKTTALPDLALCTDASYIRHRSLSHISSILNEDGTLSEYFPSTFIYAYPKGINEK